MQNTLPLPSAAVLQMTGCVAAVKVSARRAIWDQRARRRRRDPPRAAIVAPTVGIECRPARLSAWPGRTPSGCCSARSPSTRASCGGTSGRARLPTSSAPSVTPLRPATLRAFLRAQKTTQPFSVLTLTLAGHTLLSTPMLVRLRGGRGNTGAESLGWRSRLGSSILWGGL